MENLTYTQALNKLEDIVRKMQSPECDIDQLADYTEEALKLLTYCKEKLHKTDEAVKACLERLAATQQ